MNVLKFVLCLVPLLGLSACSSVKYSDIAKASPAQTSLNEGYSILAYLMKDESNLDKILWIKDAGPGVTGVIQNIAKTSRATRDRLADLALEKPVLNLRTSSLPAVESETRDAISKSTASTLLGNSGRDFELRILLTQVQAMNYAAHLCQVLASSDSNKERSAFLNQQGKTFLQLREEAVKLVGNP